MWRNVISEGVLGGVGWVLV